MPGIPAPSDLTLAELWRRFEDSKEDTNVKITGLHNHVDRRFDEVMRTMKEISFVPRGEYEAKHESLRREMRDAIGAAMSEIRDIKEADTWRSRLIVATLVSGIVSVIVAGLVLAIQLAAT